MEEMTSLLAQYGLALVFVNVLIHQSGIPVPAVPLLVVTGALVQQGQLSLALLLGVVVLASLLADIPWFYAGRRFGYPILNALCRIAIEPDSCVKQTENIYERWGAPSLLVAKFIPGFATVAPPLAGTMRLAFAPFVAYSAAGAAIWAGVAIGAGMIFHSEVGLALAWLGKMGIGALTAIVAILIFYMTVKWIERWMFIRLMRQVRISVDDLHELMQREYRPVVLDVRSRTARKLDPRRIPGAIAVDINTPERALPLAAADRDIVVYCT